MSGHHHHDHGSHCHGDDGHDHSNDITPALQSLLYSQIQFDSIVTLNGKGGIVTDVVLYLFKILYLGTNPKL